VREGTTAERVVALTFDDGPSAWTDSILDVLAAHEARATFFVIGEAVVGREETLRRAVREGHEVGNHTMTHPRLDLVPRRAVRRELTQTARLLRRVTDEAPVLFRPPGFHHSWPVLEVALECGYDRAILASVAFDDFNRASAEEIVRPVVEEARPGAIIGLHDGRPPRERANGGTLATREPVVAAVRKIVPSLALDGYRFLTVSELLAMP
jgi:peptidoglycan/xylan/chitin deacetylase (PgdA/CDA1 family)